MKLKCELKEWTSHVRSWKQEVTGWRQEVTGWKQEVTGWKQRRSQVENKRGKILGGNYPQKKCQGEIFLKQFPPSDTNLKLDLQHFTSKTEGRGTDKGRMREG